MLRVSCTEEASKTSGPTVLYSGLQPNSEGQRGSKPFPLDLSVGLHCTALRPLGERGSRFSPSPHTCPLYVHILQTCTGFQCPPRRSHHCGCRYRSVPVPFVLVMMQTGPPTSRRLIPCWYATHVTEAAPRLNTLDVSEQPRNSRRWCQTARALLTQILYIS